MTALLVIGIVLLILTLLLCCSAVLYVQLIDQELTIRAGAFGFKFRIWSSENLDENKKYEETTGSKPEKDLVVKSTTKQKNRAEQEHTLEMIPDKEARQSPEQTADKHRKKKQQSRISDPLRELPKEKRSFAEIVHLILDLVKSALGPAGYLIHRARITSLDLTMTVGGEDAAKAALNYTAAGSSIPFLIAMLRGVMTVKVRRVEIWADFVTGETHQKVFFKFKLRLFELVYAGLCMIRNYLANTNQKQSFVPQKKRRSSVLNSKMRTEK